jgi:poly-gamma-glutamate synthesis protein (capsule biosynthesis protein)
MDLRMDKAHAESKGFKEIQSLHPDWVPDFDSLYNFPPESRMTMIARARLTQGGVQQVGFLPVYINRDAQPEIVPPGDPRFAEIVRYVQRVSDDQGLRVRLEPEGGLVWVRRPARIAT